MHTKGYHLATRQTLDTLSTVCRVINPLNSDMDCEIFSVRIYVLFAHVYTRKTSVFSLIRKTFGESETEFDSCKISGRTQSLASTSRSPIQMVTVFLARTSRSPIQMVTVFLARTSRSPIQMVTVSLERLLQTPSTGLRHSHLRDYGRRKARFRVRECSRSASQIPPAPLPRKK